MSKCVIFFTGHSPSLPSLGLLSHLKTLCLSFITTFSMQTTHRACCRWIRTSFLLNCFFLEIVIVILLRTISFYFSLLFTKRYTSSNIFPISHLLQKIICRNLLIYICIMAIRKCKDKTNDNFTYCNRLAFHCNGNFTNNTCDLSWAWIISTYTPQRLLNIYHLKI